MNNTLKAGEGNLDLQKETVMGLDTQEETSPKWDMEANSELRAASRCPAEVSLECSQSLWRKDTLNVSAWFQNTASTYKDAQEAPNMRQLKKATTLPFRIKQVEKMDK